MICADTAHTELVTRHNTMLWQSDIARCSIRKTNGAYVVRLEDWEYDKVIKSEFKTLNGALICAEGYRGGYL